MLLLMAVIATGCSPRLHGLPTPTYEFSTGLHAIDPYALATTSDTNTGIAAKTTPGASGLTANVPIHHTNIYLTLANMDTQSQTLISVSTDVSTSATIQDTIIADNTPQVKTVPQLVIPPGEWTEFRPGGLHIMIDGLKRDLVAGDTLNLHLYFAGRTMPLIVSVPVRDQSSVDQMP